MNLGLSELTDDQLVELLQEVLQECSSRDPIIRKVSQAKINDEADLLKKKRKLAQKAWNRVKQDYIESLRREFKEAVEQKVKAGEILVVSAAEEARVIGAATHDAIQFAKTKKLEEIRATTMADLQAKVLSGDIDLYSNAEKEKMIADATETAVEWMKNQGSISIQQFAQARKRIYDNLRKMGHAKKEIDRLYGKPDQADIDLGFLVNQLLKP